MKKVLILSLLGLFALIIFILPVSSVFAVYVNGYYRSNGTYVNGYERTSPDGNPYNNYSYPGNYNPNTGTITGGNASTYLDNYYDSSPSYGSGGYSYPTTPTCPSNSYYDGASSCKCNSGYAVSGSSCVSTSMICNNQIGLMSQYNSSTNRCECMYGYEFNGSSCVYKSTTYSNPSEYTASLSNTCPINSHGSVTDSTKCNCNDGYEVNSLKTACVKKIETTTISAQNKNTFNDTHVSSDFNVPESDIEPFFATGEILRPVAFRKCPSSSCSVIRYYAETSKVNIIGKYKKGNWYQVDGNTDAKGGNGQEVKGWVGQIVFGEVIEKSKIDTSIKNENPTNNVPEKKLKWYQKLFSWI